MEAILTFFKQGGSWMYAILLTMIAGISIIVERLLYITFKNRIDTAAFVNRVTEFIQRGNISSAIEFCNMSQAILPKITKAGLEEFSRSKSPADLQNALEVAAMVEIPKLEKRTNYLGTIANVATLLGLLGTIFGLIQSFQAVAQADAAQKATLLSVGISVAMNTTAFGLIVAIPCLIIHSYIQEKTNELIDEVNQNIARIYRRLISVKG